VKIQQIAISRVLPYARNPRNNAAAVGKVAASIKEFGFRQPLVVDRDMTIIAGHTRYEAALQLRMKKVPVHVATDLSASQIKAYRIADNKVAESAEWHPELLELELADLAGDHFDLDVLGFDDAELAELLEQAEEDEDLAGAPEEIDPTMFGGATAMARASAPIKYWRAQGLLTGEVLDFGAGHDTHEFAKYDPFHAPDVTLLFRAWDVVMCNYVLNVQPADHLVVQLAVLIRSLLVPEGKALISVRNDMEPGVHRSDRGYQMIKRAGEWEELLEPVFELEPVEAKSFLGWIGTIGEG